MLFSSRYNVCAAQHHTFLTGETQAAVCLLAQSWLGTMMPSISGPHMLLRNPIARDIGEEAKSSTALLKLD